MYTISPLEWATPVLYLRADDARLFDITRHTPPSTSVATMYIEEGDRLRKQRLFAEAETAYRTAVALDPVLAPAHAGLGDALYWLKRYPEAEATCREAIRLDPADGIARGNLRIAAGTPVFHGTAVAASAMDVSPVDGAAANYLPPALSRIFRIPTISIYFYRCYPRSFSITSVQRLQSVSVN